MRTDLLLYAVCFNNEVKLLGDGTQEPLIIAGDKLYNHDAILELGKTFKIVNCIKESKEVLSKKLYELEEMGSTALGPAVVVSNTFPAVFKLNMASNT